MRVYRLVFNGFTYRVQKRVRVWWCPFVWSWQTDGFYTGLPPATLTFWPLEYRTRDDAQKALTEARLKESARVAKWREVGA